MLWVEMQLVVTLQQHQQVAQVALEQSLVQEAVLVTDHLVLVLTLLGLQTPQVAAAAVVITAAAAVESLRMAAHNQMAQAAVAAEHHGPVAVVLPQMQPLHMKMVL
jgi:uncharacterized membrane protein YphA (DoxX/SURF4 family)